MRRSLHLPTAIMALAVAAAPVWGQAGPRAQSVPGLTVHTTLLLPTPTGEGQFPSGRFAVEKSIGSFGLHAGALHLTPEFAGLWAGVAGASVNLFEGPFQAAPFVEAGYGKAVGRRVAGRVIREGRPDSIRWAEASAMAPGAGAGIMVEWRLRPLLSLSGTAGYWHFMPGNELEAVSGPFAGAGMRVGLPFGTIPARPTVLAGGAIQIQIEEPSAWSTSGTRGLRAVTKNSIRVVGTARDPGGVAIHEVRLNGQLAALRPMDTGGSLARFVGFVPVTEETLGVEVTALSADGRRVTTSYEVTPTIARVSDNEAAAAAARSIEGVKGKRFAVVIGISDYVDEAIPDLDYADDDAQAFYEFLRSERAGLGGLAEENITLLLNEQATYRSMRSALYTFLEQATDDDVVYIYIAAHGAPNPNRPDDLFILPHDAEANDIAGTGFPMQDVNEAIRKLYARHTVLLTDACHSGGIGSSAFATRSSPGEALNAINRAFLQDLQATQGGLAILTASEARQLSREGEQWGGGHGVFTHFLLTGLEGAADTDGDQIIRLGEVLEYVRDAVRRETNNAQIPSFGSNAFDRFMPIAIVPPADEGS